MLVKERGSVKFLSETFSRFTTFEPTLQDINQHEYTLMIYI